MSLYLSCRTSWRVTRRLSYWSDTRLRDMQRMSHDTQRHWNVTRPPGPPYFSLSCVLLVFGFVLQFLQSSVMSIVVKA